MSKKLGKLVMVATAIAVLIAVLVACAPDFTPVGNGDFDAASESNSGYVVKQGAYYYFINGYNAATSISKESDNEFGKVVKGSIMRTRKNDDGTWATAETVVPKLVVSSNTTQGFSIFGEYIYYTTPSIKTDKYGALQTTYTEFYRMNIASGDNVMLANLPSEVTSFKFTPNALIYLDGTTLKSIAYNGKATATIAEEVANTIFPGAENYKADSAVTPDNFVYYTKTPEDSAGLYNEVYAVTGTDEPIKLIGNGTLAEGKKFTVTPKYFDTESDGNCVLYYEKTDKTDGRTDALGLFGIKLSTDEFNNGTFSFKEEKQFTNISGASVMPVSYDDGMLVDTADEVSKYFYLSNIVDGAPAETTYYRYPSSKTLSMNSIVKEGGKTYLYYKDSNKLLRIELDVANGFVERTALVVADNIKSDWLPLERIGDDFFFMNTKYLTYVHVFNINQLTGENYDKTIGLERKDLTLIGKMTSDDKESYDKTVKAEDEAEEENA